MNGAPVTSGVAKPAVVRRIEHDQRIVCRSGVGAKRQFARRFVRREAATRLEPLAVAIDE